MGVYNILENYYKNKIPILKNSDYKVISPREDGVLVIDSNEELLWVSLDNNIYNSSEDLFFKQLVSEVSKEEEKLAIKQIMGSELQTTFVYDHYSLISKIINGTLEQILYLDEELIGKGKIYKTENGYRNIIIDNGKSIYADNIYEFAYIYEKRKEKVI